jgi:3-dehydroquinate synthetase
VRGVGRLPSVGDLSARQALEAIGRDKKVVAGRLHFVLASSIGSTEIVNDVRTRELVLAMKAIGMRD